MEYAQRRSGNSPRFSDSNGAPFNRYLCIWTSNGDSKSLGICELAHSSVRSTVKMFFSPSRYSCSSLCFVAVILALAVATQIPAGATCAAAQAPPTRTSSPLASETGAVNHVMTNLPEPLLLLKDFSGDGAPLLLTDLSKVPEAPLSLETLPMAGVHFNTKPVRWLSNVTRVTFKGATGGKGKGGNFYGLTYSPFGFGDSQLCLPWDDFGRQYVLDSQVRADVRGISKVTRRLNSFSSVCTSDRSNDKRG